MSFPTFQASDFIDDDADNEIITSWRSMITKELRKNGETWSDLVSITLSDDQLDKVFDSGWGGGDETEFTAWSMAFVYFPVSFDGAVWCRSVPRHPDGVSAKHQGG